MESPMKCSVVRTRNPCDTCAVRRVKCEAERPCSECRKRGLECTSLRERKKRGPKGPRQSTGDKVRLLQRNTVLAVAKRHDLASPAAADTPISEAGEYFETLKPFICSCFRESLPHSRQSACYGPQAKRILSLSVYFHFIETFRRRLYPIWPVLSADRLMADMAFNENDCENYALAAALCAATISQLRLKEHVNSRDSVSSLAFAMEAERARSSYDYRESCNISSLLTSFFLHIYYSNANKLRTAAVFLREAITCCHTLELHRTDNFTALGSVEQSLRLRVYWLLFISERTFAAQNGLPTIMQPIDTLPHSEDDPNGADLRAFTSLTHLFSFLRTPGKAIGDGQADSGSTEVAAIQAKLASDSDDSALNDTQRVDLCITRQWIRILTWEYMTRHFPMSRNANDPAFSLLLPMQIGREILSFFANIDPAFIIAHGYGMELKVFRVADAVMDIMTCFAGSTSADAMTLGAGDVLTSLQKVIFTVGGERSDFFGKLQRRLGVLDISAKGPQRALCAVEEEPEPAAEKQMEMNGSEQEWIWDSVNSDSLDGVLLGQ